MTKTMYECNYCGKQVEDWKESRGWIHFQALSGVVILNVCKANGELFSNQLATLDFDKNNCLFYWMSDIIGTS